MSGRRKKNKSEQIDEIEIYSKSWRNTSGLNLLFRRLFVKTIRKASVTVSILNLLEFRFKRLLFENNNVVWKKFINGERISSIGWAHVLNAFQPKMKRELNYYLILVCDFGSAIVLGIHKILIWLNLRHIHFNLVQQRTKILFSLWKWYSLIFHQTHAFYEF